MTSPETNDHVPPGAPSAVTGALRETKAETTPETPRRQRRELWVVLAVVGLSLLAAAAFYWWLNVLISTDDAQIDAYLAPVSSRVAGYVQAVYVDDNERVKAGQVLVDLDPRDYQTALNQARAQLHQAEAQLRAATPNVAITSTSTTTDVENSAADVENAKAELAAAERSYASAVSDIAQAEANSAKADRDEVRYRGLVEKSDISQELYDEKSSVAKALRAQVAARRATAESAQHSVNAQQALLDQALQRLERDAKNAPRTVATYRSVVDQRQAAVEQAQAQAEQALLNLSYCHIVSPVNGIVGRRSAQSGAQVAAGQQLLIVTPLDDIWVTANFRETQIARIRPGQRVRIHVDAFPHEFTGFVESMPGATGSLYTLLPPENATGNYVKVVQRLPVRIRFDARQQDYERLRPGMSVEPRVLTGNLLPW